MLALRSPVKLTWKGKDYEVLPTFKLLARIEGPDGFALQNSLVEEKMAPRIWLIRCSLLECGVLADLDEVYLEIMKNPKQWFVKANEIAVALIAPNKDEEGGEDGAADGEGGADDDSPLEKAEK